MDAHWKILDKKEGEKSGCGQKITGNRPENSRFGVVFPGAWERAGTLNGRAGDRIPAVSVKRLGKDLPIPGALQNSLTRTVASP
jgi:hypothetical protein